MKKAKARHRLGLIGIISLLAFSYNVKATENALKASYWVFENNLNDKSYTVVRFYNYKDEVIHEKKLDGVYLTPKKREIKRLNKEMAQYNASKNHSKAKKRNKNKF